jgi:hypothetical protein
VVALLAVQAAMVFAFVFPGNKPEPHHVPVAFVGSSKIEGALKAKSGGAISFRSYDSEQAARAAIENRDVYGAFVTDGRHNRLLVASAASLSVAQMLRGAATHATFPVQVQDTAPLPENDPRGATINLMFLPLIVVCFTAVMALGTLRLTRVKLVGAVALFAALGGVGVAALVSLGLGALPGSFVALAGVTALSILAMALPTAGFHRLLGPPGVVVGAVLFLVIGNPASGNGTAPELLPGFWRWISQLMPPGAGGTGIRDVAYFDGNATAKPLLVLAVYALIGAMLVAAADARRRRRARANHESSPVGVRSGADLQHAA